MTRTFGCICEYVTGTVENCIIEDIFSFAFFLVLSSLKLSWRKMDEMKESCNLLAFFCFFVYYLTGTVSWVDYAASLVDG